MVIISELTTVTLTLFSVIDSVGNIPYIIQIQRNEGRIQSGKATLIAAGLMLTFLFLGDSVIQLLGLDVPSFALAGAFVLFIIATEMILGITLMRGDACAGGSQSIVPLAFPLIAGAGTLTTIVSMRALYDLTTLVTAILINVAIVYGVLRSSSWLERHIGCTGFSIIRKVFGIVVLALAIKIVRTHIGLV